MKIPRLLESFQTISENNYLWHTDVVESVKIKSIKIQYMDKSIINIPNPESLVLQEKYLEYILNK